MKTLFIILFATAIILAGTGILLLLPGKGKKGAEQPPTGPVSPDSMIRVRPAGPGKLRMSFPQGDRMPLEVMLQIAEVKEDTDLDRLKDPSLDAKEKQEVVNRLRAMGYEIAYDPLPAGRPDVHDSMEKNEEAAPSLGQEEAHTEAFSGDTDSGRPQLGSPSGTDDRYTGFLNDSDAIPPDGYEVLPEMGDEKEATERKDESPTAEDERLREIAEEEGLGAVQLLDPGVPVEDGSDGAKAIALMEFLSAGLRNGTVQPWVARYAEELLNIQVRNAPWRDGSRQSPRSEDEFKPLDPAILRMDLDEFDIYVRDQASHISVRTAGRSGRRPVTVADFRNGGPQDLAWDRLDD